MYKLKTNLENVFCIIYHCFILFGFEIVYGILLFIYFIFFFGYFISYQIQFSNHLKIHYHEVAMSVTKKKKKRRN